MLPEAGPIGFDEHGPVLGLLRAHIVKKLGRRRISLAQALGEICKHAPIFLFE